MCRDVHAQTLTSRDCCPVFFTPWGLDRCRVYKRILCAVARQKCPASGCIISASNMSNGISTVFSWFPLNDDGASVEHGVEPGSPEF